MFIKICGSRSFVFIVFMINFLFALLMNYFEAMSLSFQAHFSEKFFLDFFLQ